MSGLMSALFQPLKLIKQTVGSISNVACSTALVKSEYPLLTTIRTKVRCYFPRPNEVRRVRRHGWKTRMSTPTGRRVIMRRLLKGRFLLFYSTLYLTF